MSELITETSEAAASSAAARAFKTATKKTRAGARKHRVAASAAKAAPRATPAKKALKAAPRGNPKPPAGKAAKEKGTRQGSRTETILGLVKRAGGATLNEIMKATGWQAHSVRGFISGTLVGKMNLTVISTRTSDGERRYSIEA